MSPWTVDGEMFPWTVDGEMSSWMVDGEMLNAKLYATAYNKIKYTSTATYNATADIYIIIITLKPIIYTVFMTRNAFADNLPNGRQASQ